MSLRRALRFNAAFSALCGFVLVFAPGPLAPEFGVATPMLLRAAGAVLIVYAAGLVLNARREAIDETEVKIAIGLCVGWVLGSAALLLAPAQLSPAGRWVVSVVALFVALFGALHALGLKRLRAGHVAGGRIVRSAAAPS